jgi:hypothetical protein
VRSFVVLSAALLSSLTLAACSSGDTVSLESVAHAASTTESAGSSRMAMVVAMSMDGKRAELVAEGAFDFERSRGWMDMDFGGMADMGGAQPLGEPIRMLVEGTTVWMRMPPSLQSATGGKPWAKTTAASGSLGMGVQQPDPGAMLDSLRGLGGSVEKKGRVSVRGASTTHYRATVDMDKAMAEAPAAQRAQAEAALKLFGGLEDIPVDLYIDDAQRVRRMEMQYGFDLFGQKLTMELKLELFDFGAPVRFERPADHEVAELPSGLGSGS